MKPAPFLYLAPTTIDEALDSLATFGDEAKLLAGGQSLIPTMNFRLAQPGVLIDLNRVPDLGYIEPTPGGGVRIGAMTRQREVERSALVAERVPLLSQAMPLIAHVQIRNRGTIGGSLAHADPAAELPAVVSALGATLLVRGPNGARRIDVGDFYTGLFETEIAADEILCEIELPPRPKRSGYAIHEVTRRQGDFALVGVAAHIDVDDSGRCQMARLVYFSVGDGPVHALDASKLLVGEHPTMALVEAAATHAAAVDLAPPGDIHASTTYRRHLAKVLGKRALIEAFGRADVVVG